MSRAAADRRTSLPRCAARAALYAVLLACPISAETAAAADCAAASKSMAELLGNKLDSSEIVSQLKKIIGECPTLAEAHYNLSLAHASRQEHGPALESIQQALTLRKDPYFYVLLGNIRMMQNELSRADEAYGEALKLEPENVRALQGASAVQIRNGNWAQAEDMLRRAVQRAPEEGAIFFNLGIVLEQLGRIDEALESFRAAVEREPSSAQANLRLGMLLGRTGKLDEAERALRSAALHDPKSFDIWLAVAAVEQQRGNLSSAETALARAAALDGERPALYASRAVLESKRGNIDEAIRLAEEGVRRAPDDAQLHGTLGWALLQRRDLARAREELERAIALNQKDPFALNNLGVLLKLEGKADEAQQAFERARSADPSLEEATRNLEAAR